ncbi:MAG: hypothetical protein P8011_16085 [Acidihalobacter sp.]|uniref:hypothetical protein n=1 Tax=Acidihalobacter sp. TaxID=1872108 RepID=UPI00307E73DE
MATAHDPEELRRFTRDIPLPAYLASRGYTATHAGMRAQTRKAHASRTPASS